MSPWVQLRFAMGFVFAVAVSAVSSVGQEKPAPVPAEARPVDLVLCLDVSGSMDGLIDSARLRLWDVVNELARLRPMPRLRVALYSYGATAYPAAAGWVRKEVDLTEDLDEVYRALNGLRTGGGEELVARVCKAALDEQKWSEDPAALKILFVCGNEPVDQDRQVSLNEVATLAKKRGVVINTIYCKYGRDEEIPGWARFAAACGGRHVDIDQNKAVNQVVIRTEYDEQIVKLGEQLNRTYVAYGKDGRQREANQLAQDRNAARAAGAPGAAPPGPSEAAIARSAFKASPLYRNSTWDLVDRMKEDPQFDLARIPEDELDDELRRLKPEQRLAFLKKKAQERAELQQKIAELSALRQKKIAEELARRPRTDAEKALDEALRSLIRDQAGAKGFRPAEGGQ